MCSDHCLWKGNLHVLIGSSGRDKAMAKGTKIDSSVSGFSVLFLISQLQDLLTVPRSEKHQQHITWSQVQQVAFVESVLPSMCATLDDLWNCF